MFKIFCHFHAFKPLLLIPTWNMTVLHVVCLLRLTVGNAMNFTYYFLDMSYISGTVL